MKLIVNGEDREFSDGSTIEQILETLQVKDKVMATAVNMEVVKKEDWSKFSPTNGDKIELLQFVGGG
jgi:sulfur carrier protein